MTFSVTLTDALGNTGAAATATAVLDQFAPEGYSISADQSIIGPADAATASFTFAGAELGTTYDYVVTSSGGAGSVTGSGTIASATQQVTGIDVSTLPEGTLTFSVTLTDVGSKTGPAATATAVFDQTAPVGYTIAVDQDPINAAAAANAGFTFAGAEIGASYSYVVTSDGGGDSVTGTGTITAADQDITGIDVSSLPDGTLTFSVTLTDAAGNAGAAATADVTLATATPANYSIMADDALIGADEAATTSFTFNGAQLGTTYNYTITSDGGAGSVTGTGTITAADQQVTGIDVSSLPDGILTYSVTLTDSANNVGDPVTTTVTLDKTIPGGYSITVNQDPIDAAAAAAVGFTFTGAEVGATYSYVITSDGGAGTVTGTGTIGAADQQVTGIDVSSLPDGTLTYSVTLTDAAGNVGDAAAATATLDKTPPAGYSIVVEQDPIDAVSAVAVSFTFTGAEIGTTFSYIITSDGGEGSVIATGTITTADQQVTDIIVANLPDGLLTFSVTLTDPAGNVGDPATATATLDQSAVDAVFGGDG